MFQHVQIDIDAVIWVVDRLAHFRTHLYLQLGTYALKTGVVLF